jgi:hypothetical protein
MSTSSSDANAGALSRSAVTFTTSNWTTAQAVTVTGVVDHVANGDVAFSVTTGQLSSSDIVFDGKWTADVSVTTLGISSWAAWSYDDDK